MLMHWGEGDVPASAHRSAAGQTLERHVVEETVTWTGPLPPPSAVREYETILPGTCERILTLTERQAAHRQWSEPRCSAAASRTRFRARTTAPPRRTGAPRLTSALTTVVHGNGAPAGSVSRR
jgi:hypothetical protein